MRPVVLAALILLAGSYGHARAQNLNTFMNSVAAAWAKSDADAITAMADPQGIALEVDGMHVGSVPPRQATAVLRRLFDDRRTIKATANSVKLVPGSDARAYAEIIWERRARGTTESERVNVFVALVRYKDNWRITEIRLMQQ